MKKFTAIALLAITLVACKKETKTITKVDPETGKTITVEVPVINSDSLKVETPQAEVFAIKDSLGVYKQTFKLEKGETYPLVTYQKDVQTMTAPDGKSQSGTSEMTDEMSFIRLLDGRYSAHGTPFSGELGRPGENISAPLGGVFLLAKGPENRIDPLSPTEAVRALMANILYFAKDDALTAKVFDNAIALAARVPVQRLTFFPDTRVWELFGHNA